MNLLSGGLVYQFIQDGKMCCIKVLYSVFHDQVHSVFTFVIPPIIVFYYVGGICIIKVFS